MKRKVLRIVLAICVAVSLLPAGVIETSAAEVWDGATVSTLSVVDMSKDYNASTNPLAISSGADLAYLAQQVNSGGNIAYADSSHAGGGGSTPANYASYRLTDDIVLNDETYTFDSASGILTVTDGANTGYLGTGINGTAYNTATAGTSGAWYTSASLTGMLATGSYGGNFNLWTPIGTSYSNCFGGTLDGGIYESGSLAGCHTVSGIYTITSSNYQGLLGYMVSSTIKNVGVINSYIKGGSYTASIAGASLFGAVQNCYNAGSITGADYVGGIEGWYNQTTVKNCYNTGSVSGDNYIGGVTGENYNGATEKCHNTGRVSGYSDVGGVTGYNYSSTEQSCYNTGSVSGNVAVGGVAGRSYGTGTIQYCYNTGSVAGGTYYTGGVLGSNTGTGTTQYCYNAGAVAGGTYYTGGVLGYNTSTIQYCYNAGAVSGVNYVGGVTGDSSGTVTGCYYDKQMCTYPSPSDPGKGRLTADMVNTGLSGTGWSTAEGWIFTPGLYPRLADPDSTFDMDGADAAVLYASSAIFNSSDTVSNVTHGFSLGLGTTEKPVSWTSSDSDVISISGGAAAINNSGTNVTLTAALAGGMSRTVTISTVTEPVPPTITTATLPGGTVGAAYSQTLSATGDTPITWTVESGSLPTGLTLSAIGTISGTPITVGTSNFTVKAENAAGSDTKALSIAIAAVPAIDQISRNYDLNTPGEITTAIIWNNAVSVTNVVYCIRPDATVYTLGTDDYTVSANDLTIENSFFSDLSLATGAAIDFTVTFNTGAEATLTVHVVDSFVAAPVTTHTRKGGSTSTTTSPNYNAEVKGSGAETTRPVTVDKGSGTASTDAGSQKLTSDGTVMTVPAIPDVNTYSVGIPVPDLSTSNPQGTLTLRTDNGSVTVSSNMLTDVSGVSGSKAEISIGQGDKNNLPDDVKAVIGDRPIIELTLSIDGKQTDWSNPNAPVTVSIPYTPTAEELAHPESIVVWYIDGAGNAVSVPNGQYDPATGMMTVDVTHFSDYAVAYNPVIFSDVEQSAWYGKAVSFIAARKITGGTGSGNYSPAAKLTRGEFLVLMMRAYGIAPDTDLANNFSDAGNTYYTGYLAAAKRLGISSGVGNNKYTPGNEITRQEMFTLMYNSLKVIGQLPQGESGNSLSSFSDAGQIDSWARDAMTLLVETGKINGNAGKLAPASTTTRAEMAQVLYTLLSK